MDQTGSKYLVLFGDLVDRFCVTDIFLRISRLLQVFGSFATGLCLQHSDVDVVVVDAPTPPDTPEIAALSGARLLCPLIRALSASLKDYEWCEGINTIETASMPVIKLRCRPVKANEFSSEPPVAIDVTIGGRRSENFAGVSQENSRKEAQGNKPLNAAFEAARNAHNGAAAREFVIEKLRQFPALAPLVGYRTTSLTLFFSTGYRFFCKIVACCLCSCGR